MMNLQVTRCSSSLQRGLCRSGVSSSQRLPHAHACPAKIFAACNNLSRRETLAAAAGTSTVAAMAGSSRAYAAATEQAQQIPETKLNNGAKLPLLGLGTWRAMPDEVAESAVETAVKAGYRHIDTAKAYGNEEGVGRGIANALRGGVRTRDELFVVTKLFNDDHQTVEAAAKTSLSKLGLDYLDLYLVHWPVSDKPGTDLIPPYQETWQAMERLVDDGLVRSIGVSNMTAKKLEDMLSYARIKPAVNQVEVHPYWRNEKTVKYCREHDIHVTAYSPLGSIAASADSGAQLVTEDPTVHEVAKRVGKTPSQVLLRWLVQQGISAIPKAATNSHIINNLHVLDWELSDADMQQLSSLEHQERTCKGDFFLNEQGPYRMLDELWDGEGY